MKFSQKKLIHSIDLSENNKTKLLSGIIADIDDTYAKRRINNEYYASLKKEISVLYEEIFKKKIDSLNNLPGDDKVKLVGENKR